MKRLFFFMAMTMFVATGVFAQISTIAKTGGVLSLKDGFDKHDSDYLGNLFEVSYVVGNAHGFSVRCVAE